MGEVIGYLETGAFHTDIEASHPLDDDESCGGLSDVDGTMWTIKVLWRRTMRWRKDDLVMFCSTSWSELIAVSW